MTYTANDIRAMTGVDLSRGELDALLDGPSRLLPLIGKVLGDQFADAGKKVEKPKHKRFKGPNGETLAELQYRTRFLETLTGVDWVYTGRSRKGYRLPITERRSYTPDFRVIVGNITIYVECKGAYVLNPKCEKMFKAEMIRLDVAAERHDAVFLLAIKDGKNWTFGAWKDGGIQLRFPTRYCTALASKRVTTIEETDHDRT